jgi:pentatricopeptide repeat protein
LIYQHLRANELAEAFSVFEEMRLVGEQPSHAVYEMLIRGCAIAMHRPKIGSRPDHLTLNLVQKVLELWGDMEAMGRAADYLTYIELIRALGKGGALPQALQLFEKMCSSVRLLPEERAFNSIYEQCVMSGAYLEALKIFDEQEEMRKSLWKPRFTPVTFSLLLTATAEIGDMQGERLRYLPRVLSQMGGHGVLPRAETCDRLISECVRAGELDTASEVLQIARRAGHELDAKGVAALERRLAANGGPGRSRKVGT